MFKDTIDRSSPPVPTLVKVVVGVVAVLMVGGLGKAIYDGVRPTDYDLRLRALDSEPMASPHVPPGAEVQRTSTANPSWSETVMGTEPDPAITTYYDVVAGDGAQIVGHLVDQAQAAGWTIDEDASDVETPRRTGRKEIDGKPAEIDISYVEVIGVRVKVSLPLYRYGLPSDDPTAEDPSRPFNLTESETPPQPQGYSESVGDDPTMDS